MAVLHFFLVNSPLIYILFSLDENRLISINSKFNSDLDYTPFSFIENTPFNKNQKQYIYLPVSFENLEKNGGINIRRIFWDKAVQDYTAIRLNKYIYIYWDKAVQDYTAIRLNKYILRCTYTSSHLLITVWLFFKITVYTVRTRKLWNRRRHYSK